MDGSTAPPYCVTGANGYVGSHLVRELLARGRRVRATVRDPADDRRTAHLHATAREAGAAGRLEIVAADLMAEGSFDAAVAGCAGVYHTAAAVTFSAKDPARDIVEPSVQGTLNVLRSVARAGTVRRVVHTSSCAAAYAFDKPADHVFTEADWNDGSTLEVDPYGLAKVTAERAAVDFVASLPEGGRPSLVSVLPGIVFGPPLAKAHAKASAVYVRDIVSRSLPGLPRIHFAIVDVRDLAAALVAAMETPEASGRYLLVAEHAWLPEIGRRLERLFPDIRVTTRTIPGFAALVYALFDDDLNPRQIRKLLGRTLRYDSGRALSQLGVAFRPLDETLADTARVMIERGWARTTPR